MSYFWLIRISKVVAAPTILGTLIVVLLLSILEDSYHIGIREVLYIHHEYVFYLISLPFDAKHPSIQ